MTIQQLKAIFQTKGYVWPSFHLIGIRSKADKPNEFDDKFYLIDHNEILEYTGTTNPGTHWLQNIMNPLGAAVLKQGQYFNTWELGLHRGMYKAWVQVKPVTVYRDKNKDGKSDEIGEVYSGIFGINIHRANENAVSKFVDKWSAGCQVMNNPDHYRGFITRSDASGQKYFTYTLLKEI